MLALNNNSLVRWESDQENHICFADFAVQPRTLGGRRLAIVCFDNDAAIRDAPICAFDVDKSLTDPIWTADISPTEVPSDERERPERHVYKVRFASIVDVFPGQLNPGPELLAIFRHDFSRSALRLYSLDGRILYQVWQDGGMHSALWLDGPGLLVVNADDEKVKEAHHANGATNGIGHVLFALKPQYLGVHNEYVAQDAAQEQLRPVWHQYWHPIHEPTRPWRVEFNYEGLGSRPRNSFIGIMVTVRHPSDELATFRLVLDSQGREVPGSRNLADDYNFLQDGLPDSDSFYLSDSPPTDLMIDN